VVLGSVRAGAQVRLRQDLGLGKLYRRAGRRQEAQEHLATAMTMYLEMDMRIWLETAQAETKGLA
jgi:hypothetical protein